MAVQLQPWTRRASITMDVYVYEFDSAKRREHQPADRAKIDQADLLLLEEENAAAGRR